MINTEDIERELLAFRNLCSELNIPEYCEKLSDTEILLLGLYQLESFVDREQERIWEDINEES